ncbi:hypothetical protein Rcae01_01045 [Novipirellula caenicola]|uniref:Uncharacterized protein n=1 Tax=Novipirellula caenicola TaxID=1536901 RepID=A0ABP9VLW8_9BACT
MGDKKMKAKEGGLSIHRLFHLSVAAIFLSIYRPSKDRTKFTESRARDVIPKT